MGVYLVRVWCTFIELLDRQRLLGMHREVPVLLYAGIKHNNKQHGGFVNHPETIKYCNRLGELKHLHDNIIVPELEYRGHNHNSPLKEETKYLGYEYFIFSYEECIRDILELTLRQVIDKIKPAKSKSSSRATKEINNIFMV